MPETVNGGDTQSGTGVSVTINELQINGFINANGVANFLGISYAEIPARFRQARLLDPRKMSGVVDATRWGPRNHQPVAIDPKVRSYLYEGTLPSSEIPFTEFQTLRLNVFAPPEVVMHHPSTEKLPVLVWIHGGGWTVGDGQSQYGECCTTRTHYSWHRHSLTKQMAVSWSNTQPSSSGSHLSMSASNTGSASMAFWRQKNSRPRLSAMAKSTLLTRESTTSVLHYCG